MLILLFLVSLQTTENEGRPFRTTTEAKLKVDPAFYNRTAQLIQLVSHLDDDDPVDPEWTDFRKQYYPDHESYWEYFNLNWTDDTGPEPLDLYRDLVKLIIETNQEGITGTVQVFATTLPPAPMRRSFRKHRVKNPEVIEQYRRKWKKSKKLKKSRKSKKHSTSSSSDDGSDESLGMRRMFDSDDESDRLVTVRRMREIERPEVYKSPGKPEARISEFNFEKIPSFEEGSTYLRSLYAGDQDNFGWVKNDNWNAPNLQLDTQDFFDNQGNDWDQTNVKDQVKKKIAWDDDPYGKKTTEKSHTVNKNEWDNVGFPSNDNKKGKWDDILTKQDKNKKISWDDDLGKSNSWGKQDKKKADNDWDKPKAKINKWDEPKKAKISDWDKPLVTTKGVDDNDKFKKHLDDEWSKPKKKYDFDTYGNKKLKEYDDSGTSKKQGKGGVVDKDDLNDFKKKKPGWNDYDEPKVQHGNKNKTDLRTMFKNDEWDNIGRSKKDDWDKKGDWDKKDKWDEKFTKQDARDDKPTKKDAWDSKPNKKPSWDDKPMKKDSWEDKPLKKDRWDDKLSKKDSWDDKPFKKDNNNKKIKKNSREKPYKKDSWEDKPRKKDSWEASPKKIDKWNDQKDKTNKGWNEPKKSRDWDPPPVKKRKHDDKDYYDRPRGKHAKRDRDMLNVRTPIPFIGKRGIYEDV